MTKPKPANPQYERQPLRSHAKTFSCDPLLLEELLASYRIWGVDPNVKPNPKGSRR